MSREDLRPYRTREESLAGTARREELKAAKRLTVQEDLVTELLTPLVGQRLNAVTVLRGWRAKDLDELYVQKAFPSRWRAVYLATLRKLRRQYDVGGAPTAQYGILCQRVAALSTSVMMLEASRDPESNVPVNDVKLDQELRNYVAQLQKYTEAEKRISIVQEEVVVTTLTRVVSIAEMVISDPRQRSAFLRALQANVGEEQGNLVLDSGSGAPPGLLVGGTPPLSSAEGGEPPTDTPGAGGS